MESQQVTDRILAQPGCLAAAIARAMIREADDYGRERAFRFVVHQVAQETVKQWMEPLVED